jgi:hypothetical protein
MRDTRKSPPNLVLQRTDTAVSFEPLSLLETPSAPRVISVDRFRRGVVIAFDDGKCALYSSDLLHGTFPQAEELKEMVWLTETSRRQP